MLLDKENMTRQYIDDYLSLYHIESNNLLEVSTMDLLIEFAKVGLGVACVIRQFVEKELEEGSLVEIPMEASMSKRNRFCLFRQYPANLSCERIYRIL